MILCSVNIPGSIAGISRRRGVCILMLNMGDNNRGMTKIGHIRRSGIIGGYWSVPSTKQTTSMGSFSEMPKELFIKAALLLGKKHIFIQSSSRIKTLATYQCTMNNILNEPPLSENPHEEWNFLERMEISCWWFSSAFPCPQQPKALGYKKKEEHQY